MNYTGNPGAQHHQWPVPWIRPGRPALDSYETYRLQYVMNVSYKIFNNFFDAISNQNDRASTIIADRYYQILSKKAMIEEQLNNPHKHSNSHES